MPLELQFEANTYIRYHIEDGKIIIEKACRDRPLRPNLFSKVVCITEAKTLSELGEYINRIEKNEGTPK